MWLPTCCEISVSRRRLERSSPLWTPCPLARMIGPSPWTPPRCLSPGCRNGGRGWIVFAPSVGSTLSSTELVELVERVASEGNAADGMTG